MTWNRVRTKDKLAFREDLQSDPTLSDLQKRMISVIATHWDGRAMHAECSLTFIAAGARTTKKMVNKYADSLVASGRVSIERRATYTESTLWAVNWWFRGSAWVRQSNGGMPILDCRQQSPTDAHEESPANAHGESPNDAWGSPPSGGPSPLLKERDTGAPRGPRPLSGARPGAPEEKEDKGGNPHKVAPGFARWKIVHAEYQDDTFVAHLRSGRGRKFVLRCDVDSDEYAAIDDAIGIDGEADAIVGEMVAMSTNRSGARAFMRAGPLPWRSCTILSGESTDDGAATVHVRLDDNGRDATLNLPAADAQRLVAACGGEDSAIGVRVRYRLLPDDSLQFRLISNSAG